jgi:tetratricopeptide (TPR) repeat protein
MMRRKAVVCGSLGRGLIGGIATVLALAGPAHADDKPGNDKLLIAPPGAWVVPAAIPADDGQGGDAAVKILLRDEQDDLQPGRVTTYGESVFKLQTAQGLPAGAVSFAWDPATQVATVHKLQIRRGAQVIDVLAGGQTFTVVRRETNLESAVLDGQLTASIQPEGLQVGDIVDLAVSITTSDPAQGRHVELTGAAWNGVPIARAHFRAQWPSSVPMRVQPSAGLTVSKVAHKDGLASVEIAMDKVEPLVMPNGAPVRYRLGRMIEMSDLATWSGVSALMTPLFAKAEVLPADSPIQAEIARIRALSPDPKVRAEAALALVQERVRYVLLSLNDGGLVPADAATTWARRFGDCKGKTVLLLAILHALGIEAQPVLVNTMLGDGMDARLPAIGMFNHVITRATIAGRTYWLDGTRVGDRVLDGIETPDFHWGLPLVPGTTALVAMAPPPDDRPRLTVDIAIDARNGLTIPALIHIERKMRGDEAVGTNLALANLTGDARQQALRQFWKGRYDFADPTSFTSTFDPLTRELSMGMDGTTKMDWNEGWYEADHVWVGFKADFSRDPGADKDAPYQVGYPGFTRVTETIQLPVGTGTFTVTPGSDVDQSVAGHEYHRHARVEGDRFIVEQSERSLAPEFPAAQALAAQDTLRALAKKNVILNRPANYNGTLAEREAVMKSEPTTMPLLLKKVAVFLDVHRNDEAIATADKALALDPKSGAALALRSVGYVAKGDKVHAKADLDAAAALAPDTREVLLARSYYGQMAHDPAQTIAALDVLLRATPGNAGLLLDRAQAHHDMGHDDLAMADADAAVKLAPQNARLRLLRANILRARGDLPGTVKEADALLAAQPKDVFSYVVASRIYDSAARPAEAMHALDGALAIKPEGYIYLNRFDIRPKTDVAGRQADLDEAFRLDPKSLATIESKAGFQGERGDWRGAVTTLSAGIASGPAGRALLVRRGVAYAKAGDKALADKDFAEARVDATTPGALNNLCWVKALAGVALERALDECSAALAQSDNAVNIMDSRAFVLLRLGRVDEALAEYNRVLTKQPGLPASLYGRALAEARKGDHAAADRDVAAALKINARVGEEFGGYVATMKPEALPAAIRAS